jgi:hypothetical protein
VWLLDSPDESGSLSDQSLSRLLPADYANRRNLNRSPKSVQRATVQTSTSPRLGAINEKLIWPPFMVRSLK